MRALVIEEFGRHATVQQVADPAPSEDGVVVQVEATGVCRSDWHAWSGHDTSIALPHVPGHELAGTVVAVGSRVRRWSVAFMQWPGVGEVVSRSPGLMVAPDASARA